MRKDILIATVTEGDLQRPDFFRMIGCEVHLGKPKKGSAALDYVVIPELPRERTSFDVLNRMQEIGVQVISWHPIPGAILLVPFKKAKEKRPKSAAILISAEESEKIQELIDLKPHLVIVEGVQEWMDALKAAGILIIVKSNADALVGALSLNDRVQSAEIAG